MLVKPQFECGVETARKYKGIIKDFNVHKNVLEKVWKDFEDNNLNVLDLTLSPIFGGDGNIEYLILAKPNFLVQKLCENMKNQKIESVLLIAKEKMQNKSIKQI